MMKREEAINLIGWLKSKTNRDDDLEAIDMAIEALKNEPILCEDCKHKRTCAKTVNMTKIESNSITSWVQPLDFCSCGERKEP